MDKNWDIVIFGLALPAAAYWLVTSVFHLGHDAKTALAAVISMAALFILVKRHG